MYSWEKLCFQCEIEPERNGKFFCSTSNQKCKIKQEVEKGTIPRTALRTGAPVIKQDTSGFDDAPLWKQKDNMTDFCRNVMKFPENVILWSD